jgi:TonB family protein
VFPVALLCFITTAGRFAAAAEPAPPTSQFVAPRMAHKVDAVYPEEAQKQGITGVVLLQLVIDKTGHVKDASVARGAGHGFDESALAAARQLVFEPATQGGVPVAVQINYEISFVLSQVPTLKGVTVAGNGPPVAESQVTIKGDRPSIAASAFTVSAQDVLIRPRLTPEDILNNVPGITLMQHQGGGKADQILIRGFDADHGTDVAFFLDDMPINLPSHAHGQGYTDLNFVIPEVLEKMEVEKGPYSADKGDFATAGAVNLVTRDVIEKSQITLEGGTFGTGRLVGILAPQIGVLHPWFAVELYTTNGPFQNPEDQLRYNLQSKLTWEIGTHTKASLFFTAYGSGWSASGLIPTYLVDEGKLSPWGSLDPTEGGQTQRQQVILSLSSRPDPETRFKVSLSVEHYALAIFNNFTFDLRDPLNGDEIEQDDERVVVLADLRYDKTFRPVLQGFITGSVGAQFRDDSINAQLWHVKQRVRLPQCFAIENPCVDTNDNQLDAAAYAQLDWKINRIFRVIAGVRGDLFEFDVHSLTLQTMQTDVDFPSNLAPTVQAGIVSPKLSVTATPLQQLELFLNFGSGFHSNDARSIIEAGGVGALPRALGGEVGGRTKLLDGRLTFSLALWLLHLESEQVWDGDTGGTTPAGPSLRYGVEISGKWYILPWLSADADLSLTHSQYETPAWAGNAIAYAPPLVLQAGITARHPIGISGSLRLRTISNRPANTFSQQDGVPACTTQLDASTSAGQNCFLVAEGYTVLDLSLGYDRPHWGVGVIITNLTDASYRDAQIGQISQTSYDSHPVQAVFYTPGYPLGVLAQASYRF